MVNDDGENGDRYMRDIEEAVASVPYLVGPGNHEDQDNDCYNQYFLLED